MPAPTNHRPNRFEGTCRRCQGRVPAGEGILDREFGGVWTVEHTEGNCIAVPMWTTPPPAPPVRNRLTTTLPAGHYAIPSAGHNDLDFYRIDRPTTGRYAGLTFVKVVVGGRPARRLPRSLAQPVIDRIEAHGAQEAAQTYGREIGRCYRCNRHLTDEESRRLGIGPDCRGRSDYMASFRTAVPAAAAFEAIGHFRTVRTDRSDQQYEDYRDGIPHSSELSIIGPGQPALFSELGTGEEL